MNNATIGRLVGIGVGPGDSDLITLKAIDELKRVKTVFVPTPADGKASLALKIASAHLAPDCNIETLLFPMVKDPEALSAHWQRAARPVAAVLLKGCDCGFLTLGDPMLFSTYIYLVRAVKEIAPGARFETVPGISSAFAAAAKGEWPLAEGDDAIAFITGERIGSLPALVADFETIVIMKVGKRLPEIRTGLRALGLEKNAILAHRLGLEGESVTGVEDADDRLGYLSTIIVRTRP